jgi:dTDP-3-amino-3,4,6-trideoxy-alpha-D-glucose transaminase
LILLNDFKRQWQDIQDDATAAFAATAESGWYVLGGEVKEFEAQLAGLWGMRHAIGVASGLDAIEISLRALGCGTGDKVLTTPVSAFATTLAIVRLGAIPVFTDTGDGGLIELDAAGEALRRDPSIRFFVPVHLFGHSLDLDRLRSLASTFGVAVVEDCAQSIGAKWQGQLAGSAGISAATSFYPTKNLGGMGDGGAVLTNDPELASRVAVLRDYGQSAKYRHSVIGYNSRLDELQAALLKRAGLPRLKQWTNRRREIAARYLAEIRNDHVCVPRVPAQSHSCWHLFPVLVHAEHKHAFMNDLKSRGVLTGEHYPQAIPDQEAMATVPFEIAASGIEQARRFCRSEVSLPIHPYLLEQEVSAVIETVNRWRP